MITETLTPEGRAFAEANSSDSIVAHIALQGSSARLAGWPPHYINTAIQACNGMAPKGEEKKQ